MRFVRSRFLRAVPGIAVTFISCGDPTRPPEPGAIRVVVQASGEDITLHGLRVTVVNGPTQQLAGESEVVFFGVPPGVHAVRLDGLAVNCQVASPNPVSVSVVSNTASVAGFTVVCAARVGTVRVTTTTTGTDLDPDGYTAIVLGGPSRPVATNGSITIGNVREGPQMVTLGGVAGNCAIVGADTTTAMVQLGATADVSFSVQCQAAGRLEVAVSTSGAGPDPNGYVVAVQATSLNFTSTLPVAPNGKVTFSPLGAATDYRVTLQHVAFNCAVVGADVQTVAVTAGATTNVAFNVSCETPGLLAIVRDNHIFVIGSNGTEQGQLTNNSAANGDPAWSPDGSMIAFTREVECYGGCRHDIFVMNADGSNERRLATGWQTYQNHTYPSWSPNGRLIAFTRQHCDYYNCAAPSVWVVDLQGTQLTQIMANAAAPAWSSAGRIAFLSNRDHDAGEIYVMNDDGSNVVRLTHNDLPEASPAWSPDGSMIAFTREIECYYGCQHDIFVMNADGSNERRLATGWQSYQNHTDPSWSPNGRVIAFTRQYCDYYQCEAPSVWAVDLQGTRLSEIAPNAANPAWKP